MANLGSDDTPIVGESFGLPSGWSITENADGEVVIEDSGANVVLRRDETAGEWVTDSIDAESVSTENLDTGRTWQEVRESRSFDTVETNDTDSEIKFAIVFEGSADGTTAGLIPRVDGDAPLGAINYFIDSDERNNTPVITVPSGSTYQIDAGEDTGDYDIFRWAEFRP